MQNNIMLSKNTSSKKGEVIFDSQDSRKNPELTQKSNNKFMKNKKSEEIFEKNDLITQKNMVELPNCIDNEVNNRFFNTESCQINNKTYNKIDNVERDSLQGSYENFIRRKNFQALLGMLKIKSCSEEEKSSKQRIQKSEFQKAVLKEIFDITKFPSRQTRDDLAVLLKHSSRGIQIWFQNQRNKLLISEQEQFPGQKRKKLFEKKKTIDLTTLTNIVERNISDKIKVHWCNFINFDSESKMCNASENFTREDL